MNIYDFAQMLDGREYMHEITKDEEKQAKELGYVIVFGYSDDNAEFRGVINDEIGCYDGGEIYLDKDGILEVECDCKYAKAAKAKARKIEAVWCGGKDYAWTYDTDIPHATFDIMEDGEKYCQGIVFDLKAVL